MEYSVKCRLWKPKHLTITVFGTDSCKSFLRETPANLRSVYDIQISLSQNVQFCSMTNDFASQLLKNTLKEVLQSNKTFICMCLRHICFMWSQSAIEWDIGWNQQPNNSWILPTGLWVHSHIQHMACSTQKTKYKIKLLMVSLGAY